MIETSDKLCETSLTQMGNISYNITDFLYMSISKDIDNMTNECT